MDWRNRHYYVATFDYKSRAMRLWMLKDFHKHVTLHPRKNPDYSEALPDEDSPRGRYEMLIGCSNDEYESIEYLLRKAERNDDCCIWHEVTRRQKNNEIAES